MGGRGDTEYRIALGTAGAKEAWAASVGPLFAWEGNQRSAGPSCTPTVDGDAVFALGVNGDLLCAAAAERKVRWRLDLPKALDLAQAARRLLDAPGRGEWKTFPAGSGAGLLLRRAGAALAIERRGEGRRPRALRRRRPFGK